MSAMKEKNTKYGVNNFNSNKKMLKNLLQGPIEMIEC